MPQGCLEKAFDKAVAIHEQCKKEREAKVLLRKIRKAFLETEFRGPVHGFYMAEEERKEKRDNPPLREDWWKYE